MWVWLNKVLSVRVSVYTALRRENTRIQKFKNPKDVKMSNPIIELFKNRKFQISKRCENLKSNNRIIQKFEKFKYSKDVKM